MRPSHHPAKAVIQGLTVLSEGNNNSIELLRCLQWQIDQLKFT